MTPLQESKPAQMNWKDEGRKENNVNEAQRQNVLCCYAEFLAMKEMEI